MTCVPAILRVRRDTATNWTTVNPVLEAGQLGFETDTLKFKLGDGVTAWNSLAYAAPADIAAHLAAADPHTQYLLADGSRGLTGTMLGVTPTIAGHLATKGYVDNQDSALALALLGGLQPLDATLTALAGHTTAANKITKWTGVDTCLTIDIGSFGEDLLTMASAADARAEMGLANIASTGSASDLISGTLPSGRMPALTGDVTTSVGTVATTIANNSVTLAKMADLATGTILGRTTAGTGDPEALTGTQATALLDTFASGAKGLAPASGGGTTNFLRADGTWAAPGGGSVPTGTGFRQVVSGAETGTAQKVPLGDTNYVSGVVDELNGGTGQSSWDPGDMPYASGANTLSRIGIGATGQVLTVASGLPSWADSGSPLRVVLGSDLTSSSTTLGNATGLSFSVDADSTYYFRFFLACRTAATTTGIRLTVSTPTFGLLAAKASGIIAADGTAAAFAGAITGSDDAVICTAMPATGADYVHEVEGLISPTANGTLQLRFASEVASSQVTIKAGSVGFLTKLV